ncbi:MAG: metallophosphoesterase [Pseudomonadota bacterium]
MITSHLELTHGCARGFTWLHLSDLHVGQTSQDRLLPRFQANLASDLEALVGRVGKPFDLVIFSGDLVQQGAAEEFAQFDETIERILDQIGRFQSRPKVLTVPGNHDLVRPRSLDPSAIAIKQYWRDEALQEAFWAVDGEPYRDFIATSFANYTEWRKSAIKRGVHLEPYREGILPGDASYQLCTKDGQLGVAALNSA